ncbi:unnamed protein product [Adineta steineri]|uniref:EGF-like domain-containing protein n=2 Tax=Adineta steineri TaxID=433720 RepID=A0A815JQX0_9BILA|nr:unnamed protein product [Adineta steineri]
MVIRSWLHMYVALNCFIQRKRPRINGESCNGAVVENGTNQTIIDANNATWIITNDSTIFKDGQKAGNNGYVILLVYWNETVYQENINFHWWKWINDTWIPENNSEILSYLTSSSGCTPTTLSDLITSLETTTVETSSLSYISNKSSSNYFAPYSCNDSNYIGDFCNISMKPCDINPCYGMSNCTDDPRQLLGYSCNCMSGFTDINCDVNIQPCKVNTCLQNGLCIEMNGTDFLCNCSQGYMGIHCQDMINYCKINVTCLNEGICRSILLDYKCECLYGSSGRQCENLAADFVIRQYAAKSFAYIAIIGIVAVYIFAIILDTLKYVFGIDVTRNERRELRHKRNLHKKKNLEEQQARKTHLVLRYID